MRVEIEGKNKTVSVSGAEYFVCVKTGDGLRYIVSINGVERREVVNLPATVSVINPEDTKARVWSYGEDGERS